MKTEYFHSNISPSPHNQYMQPHYLFLKITFLSSAQSLYASYFVCTLVMSSSAYRFVIDLADNSFLESFLTSFPAFLSILLILVSFWLVMICCLIGFCFLFFFPKPFLSTADKTIPLSRCVEWWWFSNMMKDLCSVFCISLWEKDDWKKWIEQWILNSVTYSYSPRARWPKSVPSVMFCWIRHTDIKWEWRTILSRKYKS